MLGAPVASASAPANDDFADRSVLDAGFPVDLTATNVEATKEVGEPIHGTFGSSGHSVWFEWEATATGLVTIGTCGSDFSTVLGVYTGTAVDALTTVASDTYGDGPNCPSEGSEATFRATSGVTYEIAVDGNPFFVPPATPPAGGGAISLQIDATPSPVNDDFADAMALTGSVFEDPEAGIGFYSASANGFNWNAGKEVGEPNHAGDPGGASVWYSWTAPGSGSANASVCAGNQLVIGVYAGGSLDTLVPVGSNDFPCGATFDATAGMTYRIAVDGKFDAGANGALMDNFSLYVFMQLPLPPSSTDTPAKAPSSADLLAPETTISKHVLKSRPPVRVFMFHSSEPGSTFRCKLDKRPFTACGSSKRFRYLKPGGRHTLKVAAVDMAGNKDPTPAVVRFSTPKRKPRSGRSKSKTLKKPATR